MAETEERFAYLLMRGGGMGQFVGSCFDEEAALRLAERAAEETGDLTRVAKVPVIAEFGPLARLEGGRVPPPKES